MTSAVKSRKNYILIDHENVHPKNLSHLTGENFQIHLFIGAKQTSVNFGLVEAMHKLGPKRSKYIQVTETRPNALDFHITYYLGVLSAQNPNSYFHIISKDKGFDPLINHLKAEGFKAYRHDTLTNIQLNHISKDAKRDDKLNAIVANLRGRGQSKPRKEKTLKNTIKAMFSEGLPQNEINALFNTLKKMKYIKVDNESISYTLPK